MKLSSISSSAIQNAMRLTIRQSQNDMTQASLEATTGVYADIGVSLGGQTAQSIDLTRETSRIDAILGSNSIAEGRMTSSQNALSNMSTAAQDFMNQLVALRGNASGSSASLVKQTATDSLSSLIGAGNTMVNGQYIFAGTNTDVQPLTDQTASATTAIQNNLQAYASLNGTTTSQLTGAQMTDFITKYVEPAFSGTPFTPAPPTTPATPAFQTIPPWGSWSSASSQNLTSRISNSEVVDTSTNANGAGMRYLALATTVTTALSGLTLSPDAANAVTDKATSYARQAVDGLNNQASQLGLSQSRATKADDALKAQKDIFNNNIVDLQGVDPYTASTKVNSLETQLQTAYTIVSKIQQLSLVNYTW
jgi:flagellar hook-associated protein 3 FlgL